MQSVAFPHGASLVCANSHFLTHPFCVILHSGTAKHEVESGMRAHDATHLESVALTCHMQSGFSSHGIFDWYFTGHSALHLPPLL